MDVSGFSYLTTEPYRASLHLLSREKPSTTSVQISAKSRKILEKINSIQLIKVKEGSSAESSLEINEAIKKISSVRPGRKLLKKLLSQAKVIILFAKNIFINTPRFW
jgi:hypothetical protein